MQTPNAWTTLLHSLSSSKLAIALVLVLILLAIAGAVLPQEGSLESGEITRWKEAHPTVAAVFQPFGFFRIFHSWPFFAVICLLGINTLTCTVLRFVREGAFSALKGPGSVRMAGFLFLHLSLLVLFAGGFFSAVARLDGYIVLTEGQAFKEHHGGYLRLVEGPFRPERHHEFEALLKEVQVRYAQVRYPIDVTSRLDFKWQGGAVKEGTIKVNEPFTYKGLAFTQDQTGFSPRLVISEEGSGRVLIDSFVALKTFVKGGRREYRDFLPLPFLEQRVILTLYPSHRMENNRAENIGEEPESPLLVIETEDESGEVSDQRYLPAGDRISLGKHSLLFADLRRWSAFRVVDDPGYPVVLVALWMGIVALFLRYAPDLRRWNQAGE